MVSVFSINFGSKVRTEIIAIKHCDPGKHTKVNVGIKLDKLK